MPLQLPRPPSGTSAVGSGAWSDWATALTGELERFGREQSQSPAAIRKNISAPFGAVTMFPAVGFPGQWSIIGAHGEDVDVAGTATQGLQEAINHAAATGCSLQVRGGGWPSGRIICMAPLSFPAGQGISYRLDSVQLQFGNGGGFTSASDFITFDSLDFADIDFHRTEIIYPGTGAAIRFSPLTDNGEGFAGIASSHFRFGNIALVDPTTLLPQTVQGVGVRFSAAALGLGLPLGNGIIVNNEFDIGETNGGLVSIQVDDPGGSGSTFNNNVIRSPALHTSGVVAVQIGTSAGSANLIFGNIWDVVINGAAQAINLYSGKDSVGDVFLAAITGAAVGIAINASAKGNFFIGSNASATATVGTIDPTNRYFMSDGGPRRTASTAGASPYVYRNGSMQFQSVYVSNGVGGTVTKAEISADGVTYDDFGAPPANSIWPLPAGAYLRITWTITAPFVFHYE